MEDSIGIALRTEFAGYQVIFPSCPDLKVRSSLPLTYGKHRKKALESPVVAEWEGGKGQKTHNLPLHPPLVLSPLLPKLILHPLSVASRFMTGIGALPFPLLENKPAWSCRGERIKGCRGQR